MRFRISFRHIPAELSRVPGYLIPQQETIIDAPGETQAIVIQAFYDSLASIASPSDLKIGDIERLP